MGGKTLKIGDVVANKKEFHASNKLIALNFVSMDKIAVSDKSKHNDKGYKYFTGFLDDNIIRPLCIVLSQMSGYIKYFDDGGKNRSFKIEDDNVLLIHNEVWNKTKKTRNIKFHSQPIYDEKYIKTKVKAFNDVINTFFQTISEIPKERNHYTSIAARNMDFVMKIDKKN